MRQSRTFTVDALEHPVDILVDEWGIAHIQARSKRDVFIAQGFNAARDRLWQIDFWRRRNLGRLAQVFGPDYIERDRAARLFLYRGEMRSEWLAYGMETKRIVSAFVAGINAYVQLCRSDPQYLPVEFSALGYLPELWNIDDIPRMRSHGVAANVREEVARALALRDHGPETENLRRQREPAHELEIPDGLDLSLIPDDVLRVYDLATAVLPEMNIRPPGFVPDGSNNWALAGSRTASGRPILANDPHRAAAAIPGLRYITHLTAPGLDVIGAGEPGLPGVSIGHNGTAAFGLTTFAIDQEDLYVYRTNPENPLEYWYQGRWEPMHAVQESIEVLDGPPRTETLLYTRHGPVIRQDSRTHSAFALRAAWLEPGMAPYLAATQSMQAKSWEDFTAAMNRWGAPPLNQVYADAAGNIGWKPSGLMPRRPNWDGTLPVPGDGRYEWDGFHDGDELPEVHNPASGMVASANECNLPDTHPLHRKVTYDWFAPYRKQRIEEYFQDAPKSTVDHSLALQNDVLSIPARRILDSIRRIVPDGGAVPGLEMLLAWDCRLERDSAAAVLFETWYRKFLRPALKRMALSRSILDAARLEDALAATAVAEDFLADARVDIALLEGWPDDHTGRESLAAIVRDSLARAVAAVAERLGPDMGSWRWGTLHVSYMRHPMRTRLLAHGVDDQLLSIGPQSRGGSGDTVCDTAYNADWQQTSGSTFRLVVDVGAWDRSRAMNAPGQSGDPRSEHYANLFAPWARGESFPLLYACTEIQAHCHERILLEP
ncbi:penicillin acylase family protein [Castellaniella sp. S9]|uniref:penicillin acylase family protein n=1 Tax=Castellaniella sp. S9 TaxID=2993652 RepID=UPI0022B4A524|nr:penicillin acylase family protein [Castellaniella sp. S9]